MIEFQMKQLYPDHIVDSLEPINWPEERTINDFEFSYCNYRIGGVVYKKNSDVFEDAFEKELFWMKISD